MGFFDFFRTKPVEVTEQQPTEELKKFVIEFFAAKKIEVVFSETGEQFRVVKKIKKNPMILPIIMEV